MHARASGSSRATPTSASFRSHSLLADEAATAERAAAFYATFDERIAREAAWLRTERADLVVGDIPPLAFAAAARAGVPSLAVGNFTWDWIYEAYTTFDTTAPGVVSRIRGAYGEATRALRLPLHGGFEPMAGRIRDIPLVARRSTRDPRDTRRLAGVGDDRPVVLVSFGAYGAPFAPHHLALDGRLIVLTTDRDMPNRMRQARPGLVHLDLKALAKDGVRYEDLVAAVDVVVSKAGYGIVSECAANGTALLYTPRGHFREEDVFVAEMPRFLRTRELAQDDLLAGRWAEAVDALLAQPRPASPAVDGAEVAAREILEELGNQGH